MGFDTWSIKYNQGSDHGSGRALQECRQNFDGRKQKTPAFCLPLLPFIASKDIKKLSSNLHKRVKNVSKFGQKGAQILSRWYHVGLWWALGRSCGPQVPQKVDFLDPLGSLWPARGVIWAPLGTFWGRLYAKNRVFLPCDLQTHFLHHFGVHFGSILGVIWVELGFNIALDL